MARPKKDGKRTTGIQGKKGFLYIVTSNSVIKGGIKKSEKRWIATGLSDTPENVKKASEMRKTLLNRNVISVTDRNISISDYTEQLFYIFPQFNFRNFDEHRNLTIRKVITLSKFLCQDNPVFGR